MKKTALIFAALVFTTASTIADEATKDLTIAAAQISAKQTWIETEEDAQRHLQEDLAIKTKELGDKINAKLEQKLANELAQEWEI